jgi:hypothetical protein
VGGNVNAAFRRTQRLLFQPFDLATYATVGVSAWLAQLGSPASASSYPGPTGSRSGWDVPVDWADLPEASTPLVVALVVAIAVVVAGAAVVALVVLYLQCRGTFVFLDNLVHARAGLAEPWATQAEPAAALFRFRAVLLLVAFAVMAVSFGAAAAHLVTSMEASGPSFSGVVGGAALLAVGVVGTGLLAGLVDLVTIELAAPIVYARRCSVGEAFGVLRELVAEDPGGFLVYAVFRAVLAAAFGTLAGAIHLVTCGVSWLPFMGTLLVLPFLVYLRYFTLAFLAERSDELGILTRLADDQAP